MHLIKRGSVYTFRRRVPAALVPVLGRKEFTRTLGTKDRPEALRLARLLSVQLDAEWASALGACPPQIPSVIAAGVPIDFASECDRQAAKPCIAPWPKAETPPHSAESVRSDAGGCSTGTVPASGFAPVPSLEAWTPRVSCAVLTSAPARVPCLEDVLADWKRERNPEPKTVDAYEKAVIEANNPPVTVDRAGLIAIRDQWLNKGNSVATVNKKAGFLRTLLGVAVDRGLITANPAVNIELPADKRAVERRMPYTPEQAQRVLQVTEGMQGADYWLPRLARWTGARLEELHQLRRCDVGPREGQKASGSEAVLYPGIRITDGEGLRLKNAGSRRWIPLHPELLPFMQWVQGQPEGPLFPAKPDVHGILSASYSKRYGRLLRQQAGIEDSRVTFHSWRHTFADMCRASGVPPDIRHALMGHQEEGAAGIYGGGELPAGVLAEAMLKIRG